ncbi:hypothetical protein DXH95_08360 [Sphingorhabdus pulchriflava]|uniref:Lipoprotein n=1 Tax=Sphingorhabdus pulchriflava TaxID=2292257 RepID=A0A371BID9_9SPHN|nr:hypothetical protein [Sphingorhabdus pulchriflava]RDV07355.1 hypothetical protein DXH95_08360 [Sphingorhabdus pulchriflava]
MHFKKIAAIGLAIVAPMSLSGCLLLPGEFNSEMTLLADGEFSFSYKGQIQLVGLANLLNDTLDAEGAGTEFAASCYGALPDEAKSEEEKKKDKRKQKAEEKAAADSAVAEAALAEIGSADGGTAASKTSQESYDGEDTTSAAATVDESEAATAVEDAAEAAAEAAADAAEAISDDDYTERDCTPAEVEQQKKEWDETQAASKKEKEQAKKMFGAMLGGIDPSNPKTIERFTKEVERLAAWNKVEHLGNGVFMIDYSTKGKLADDFAFPVIPRYALGSPMIHITRWDNGRVRIEAPTFHNDADVSLMALMGSGSMIPGMGGAKKNLEPVEVKGTFTIRTNARILANNTDEGPADEGGMQILRWDIGPKTFGPPMALLKLVN